MLDNFPYSSPQILTDSIYISYGGHTGTSTIAQRSACYLLAEMAATNDLGTFLVSTRVTGTFMCAPEITLDFGHVNKVVQTKFISFDETVEETITGTGNDDVALRDAAYGLVDINTYHCGICTSSYSYPYHLQIVYDVGLSSGTSYLPNILLALTTVADIMLNEIIGYGNEAPGDVGVASFSNQQYSEVRKELLNTAYGNSARANFAHKLLSGFRKYRQVGLGRVWR